MAWLSGWLYRKSHVVNPAVGAGCGYQIKVVVHYGSGSASGGDVYCGGLCRADFRDTRFTDANGNLLDYWLQNKTDGDSAVFWVKIGGSLEATAQTLYVYFGRSDASTASNQASTFVGVIEGVVGAWNLEDEANQPITDWSGNANHGTASGTSVVASPFFYGKNARSGDGASDCIGIPDAAATQSGFTPPFTIIAKIKPLTNTNNARVFGKGDGFYDNNCLHLEQKGENGYQVWWRNGLSDDAGMGYSNVFLMTNEPHTVIVDFTLNHFKVYVDGSIVTEKDTSILPNGASGYPLYLLRDRLAANTNCVFGFFSLSKNGFTSPQNITDNYLDATLEAGKVLIRKWASSNQPSHGSWGGLEHLVVSTDSVSVSEATLQTDKVLLLGEDAFLVEAADVGKGDSRTRLFLVMDGVAVQLTATSP